MPPWWKTALNTLKEAGKDFQVVAKEASKEWTRKAPGDIRSCKSLADAIDYFQQQPEEDISDLFPALLKNDLVRNSLSHHFPPSPDSSVPSEQSILASEFFRFCQKNFRFDAVWKQYVATALKTGNCDEKFLRQISRDKAEEKLSVECLSLVRLLRESKQHKNFHGLLKTARLSKAVHANLETSEAMRENSTRETHAALAEIISECHVEIEKLEAEVKRATQELESSEKSHVEISVSPEVAATIEDAEAEIKKLIDQSNRKQLELTAITGKISATREEKLRLEAAIAQLQRTLEISERELKLLAEHHASVAEADVAPVESEISALVDRLTFDVTSTTNFNHKASASCADFIRFKETFLRDDLEKIKHFGAVTEETREDTVNEALAIFRHAEREFNEIAEFAEKFENFIPDINAIKELFGELEHFVEPFKLKFGEFAILRNIEVPDSPPSAPLPPLEPQQPAPAVQRKDSFEDLLGI